MIKKLFILLNILSFITINTSFSKSIGEQPLEYDFTFSGINGNFDKKSAQRGLQVYLEVCASCHGMQYIAYRSIASLGYNKDQIKKIASQFEVLDVPDEYGDINTRKARPSDSFVNPFSNDNAAKAANNGAYPPDLTLMVKARKDGANYLRSLLLGYEEPPEGFDTGSGYYNKYMSGKVIAMPQPLYGEDVEYKDGTEPSLEQEVLDVVTFLTWAAMPELEKRRSMGIKSLLFLIVMTFVFYLSYRKIWAPIKKNKIN